MEQPSLWATTTEPGCCNCWGLSTEGLCSATREATVVRGLSAATKSNSRSLQLEKAWVKQWGPWKTKNKWFFISKIIKKRKERKRYGKGPASQLVGWRLWSGFQGWLAGLTWSWGLLVVFSLPRAYHALEGSWLLVSHLLRDSGSGNRTASWCSGRERCVLLRIFSLHCPVCRGPLGAEVLTCAGHFAILYVSCSIVRDPVSLGSDTVDVLAWAGLSVCHATLALLLLGHSIVSDSLWHHELQHTRLPCPSLSSRVCSNSWPLSQWWHLTISSTVALFASCLQSFPASGSFPVSRLFISGGRNIGASASVLPGLVSFRIDWFDLLAVQLSKGLSRVQYDSLKATVLWHSAFFMVQFSRPNMTTGKTIALTRRTLLVKWCLLFNMLSGFVIAFLPNNKCLLISCLQSPSAVILEPKNTFSPSICHEMMGLDAMILLFWKF